MKYQQLPHKILKIFLVSNTQTTYYKTPIGTAKIVGNQNGIQSVSVVDEQINSSTEIPICLQNCVTQLSEYFAGTRTTFDLKLNPQGTDFQQKVWAELLNIPFGKSTTYLQQSKQLGNIKAIRAVASANGKNPISIIIPCHRVIGSDGSLTGYAGGLWRKKWLLEHESDCKQQSLF
ncbi:methylated-DNA--[protein]-cysteine S-methyltransferase [Tenacibaculum piscium]|uniref:Methylated-DNA--protein-cysteine methyltransferase n=1 Tax=Tenacibaculum piscium TaxID=1458515 RepID=A0A2H1YKR6_9FLAO|nr:methylated-DNA--[protein]-cysteine S-methyltransferase [Tenacibaculum piscium]MBE7669936.1 methylated-DNA--[protein]-cysteine S-methyltransferase [Tenacibaculum piscium]MBE7684472.1 methylated-DNA--[protein]-cysteine S-methyltransferase [Tenacibaculum piscium]SOS75587.1 Methylated-DNA--protein-cysteine methyltransferase [Tenacibaculum piscium]